MTVLLGFVILNIALRVSGILIDPILLSLAIVFVLYLPMILVALVTPLSTSLLLEFHVWFGSRFRESVERRRTDRRALARLLIGVVLSLSYWIVIYLAPWQGLLGVIPTAGFMEKLVPENFDKFMSSILNLMSTTPWYLWGLIWIVYMLVYVVLGSLGPATIFAITWLRSGMGDGSRGRNVLSLLQLVCYLSWIFLALEAVDPGNYVRLVSFAKIYLLFVLPGTCASLGMTLGIAEPRRLRHFWTKTRWTITIHNLFVCRM